MISLNKKELFFIIVFTIICSLSIIAFPKVITTDSGWGGSYDIGGSGGSSDIGGSSYSGSSSSEPMTKEEAVAILLFILETTVYYSIGKIVFRKKSKFVFPLKYTTVFFIIITILYIILFELEIAALALTYFAIIQGFIYFVYYLFDRSIVRLSSRSIQSIDKNIISEILTDYDENELRKNLYSIYKDVQIAWMDFDYDTLRKNLTDELYNTYFEQLKVLSLEGRKNIMSDFSLHQFAVKKIGNDGNNISITVEMIISCYDYVIEENSSKVVRGINNRKQVYYYQMVFIRNKNYKKKKRKICPNCGTKLEDSSSSICPNCESVIVSDSNKWVLSEKITKEQEQE